MALTGGQVGFTGYQRPDYSGVAEAAALPVRQMAGMVGQAVDYFKKQKESKNLATMGLKIAEAAKIMDPAQAPYYDNIINTLKDENTPVDVRGALGAQVQDLLKQNTSMRAVAVQEAQMGMRPAYFGGGQPAARSGGGYGAAARGYSPSVDMSAGDAALANQPGEIPLPPGPDEMVVSGEAGSDIFAIQQGIEKAKELNIPPAQINPIIAGVNTAGTQPSETSRQTIQSFGKNLSSLVANAAKNFEPAKDVKGQPQVVISEDESGNVLRFTKTKGGNLVNEYGEVLSPKGTPIEQPQYKQIDVEGIQRALYQNYDLDGKRIPQTPPGQVLNALPEETSMTQPIGTPEEQARVQRMVQEGEGRAMVQNMPQGAAATDQSLAYQTPQPQPEQKSAGLGIMAKESQARQAQSSAEELRKLTELAPRKAKLYEAALNQAYQDPKTAPSQDVVDEAKLQLLMQPESKGPQVMSEEEYNQRNVALINKAQKRVGDRSAAEVILSHFDVIQQLANHPEGSQVFGKSIPESKLRELASTEGSVLALYNNLKGRDLVQAMRDIKAQSGTAAGMSEKETMALQRAVNELDRAQDWKSAQKTLMRISSGAIRAGKKLGLDEGVFEVMPMTPATFDAKGKKLTEASKRQTTKAAEILDNPESVPMFRDEVQYFNRVSDLQRRLQGGQGMSTTPSTQQNQPQSPAARPDDVYRNLNKAFGL